MFGDLFSFCGAFYQIQFSFNCYRSRKQENAISYGKKIYKWFNDHYYAIGRQSAANITVLQLYA